MALTTAEQPVEQTIAQLRKRVGFVGFGLGRELIQETHDGLIDAAEAYQDRGLERLEAERRAVVDFGELAPVAAAIREELGAHAVRRTGLVLGLGHVVILGAWGLLYAVAPPRRAAPPATPWASSTFDVVGVTALLLAIAFLISIRWSARQQRSVRATQWLVAGAVAACSIVTLVAAQLVEPFFFLTSASTGLESPGKLLVEGLSGLLVAIMIIQAVLCARQAWGSRVAYSIDARGDEGRPV